MPKFIIIAVTLAIVCGMTGCGEAYPLEAKRYCDAAQEVLITEQVCADVQDCQRKELLFWEGGNPWLPGYDMAFVSLYETKDAVLVEAIVTKLKQVRADANMPPVKLTVRSTRHSQMNVTFREVMIK